METTGIYYLYIYPIVSSIVAGFIFWFVFSFLPERSRKKSFGVGITNDLIALNAQIFHYFDIFLRFQERTPSCFQDKIHSTSLTEEDLSIALQNKVISQAYLYDTSVSSRLLIIGDELTTMVTEINKIINRLYSFNYFLSSQEVTLLRNMHEKIHRYMPYIQSESNINRVAPFPLNPSLAFMTEVLLGLQEDFRDFRRLIFKNKLIERSYVIQKIQWLFYMGKYKDCINECNLWISRFPFDSSLQSMYLIRCHFCLNNKNVAYSLLNKFLESNTDLISYRNNLYPLLSDSTAFELISNKTSYESILEMKRIVENENLIMKQFVSSNMELKNYFSEKAK